MEKKTKFYLIALLILIVILIIIFIFRFVKQKKLKKRVETVVLSGHEPSDGLPKKGFILPVSYKNVAFSYLFSVYFMNVPYWSIGDIPNYSNSKLYLIQI